LLLEQGFRSTARESVTVAEYSDRNGLFIYAMQREAGLSGKRRRVREFPDKRVDGGKD
jgi:hypothetical protein